jgi:hypothetical protein
MQGLKPAVGRISFGLAVLTWFSGTLLLCHCPGWYAVAVAFSALSVRCSTPGLRFYAWLVLVASIVMMLLHLVAKLKGRP